MASDTTDSVSNDARWAAVQARDHHADGAFVYGRPSASARLPRRENVVFFEDAQQAEAAGVCRHIEQAETTPDLKAMAHQAGSERLGMQPRDWRAGGLNAEVRFAVGQCALGAIPVAQSGRGICAILLGDDPDALVRDLQDQFPQARLIGGDAAFEQTVAQVVGFVEQPGLGLHLPLDVQGTAFQERVWQALREIPCGQTASYAEVAARIGAPRAVRAMA